VFDVVVWTAPAYGQGHSWGHQLLKHGFRQANLKAALARSRSSASILAGPILPSGDSIPGAEGVIARITIPRTLDVPEPELQTV
jgi:hypothetical protein